MQIPILIPEAQTVVSVVALVAAVLALVLCVVVLRREAKLRRHYEALMTGVDGADLASALESFLVRLSSSEARLNAVEAGLVDIKSRLVGTVQHVSLKRYSAYADSGGDQSFSLALLDGDGDGVVLTGLYMRGGMRSYAKPIRGGESEYALTSEEESVVNRAAVVESR